MKSLVRDSDWNATLLHHSQELGLADHTVAIVVGLVNPLLEVFLCHGLAELLSNSFEVLGGDLVSAIGNDGEDLKDLLFGVRLTLRSGKEWGQRGSTGRGLNFDRGVV